MFVGYRHYDRVPREQLNFQFGHGLSYTNFALGDVKIENMTNEAFNIVTDVQNVGSMVGGVLIQLYIGRVQPSVEHPVKMLAAFKKIRLEPGQQRPVELSVFIRDFAFFDEKRKKWMVEEGEYEFSLGLSSVNILKTGQFYVTRMIWDP